MHDCNYRALAPCALSSLCIPTLSSLLCLSCEVSDPIGFILHACAYVRTHAHAYIMHIHACTYYVLVIMIICTYVFVCWDGC